MATAINEVSTFSKIPSFVPFGVLYFTQDTADLYIGTGSSNGPAVEAISGGSSFSASGTTSIATTALTNVSSAPSGDVIVADGSGNVKDSGVPLSNLLTSMTWDEIGGAAGNLTLANGTFSTTFAQTSNVAWLWTNTTAATGSTTNRSPLLELGANYYTGSASAQDTWSIGSALAAGTNGTPTLSLTHSGSTGAAAVSCNALTYTFSPATGGNTTFNMANGGSTALIQSTGGLQLLSTNNSILLLNGSLGVGMQVSGSYGYIATTVMTGTSTSVYGWAASSTNPTTSDTGISRLAAGSVAVGNGASGNTSGQITATTHTVAASASAPTSAGTAGTVGQIIANGGNLYFCSVTGAAGSATWNKLTMTSV